MRNTTNNNRKSAGHWFKCLAVLLFSVTLSVGDLYAQTYQAGEEGKPFKYNRVTVTEKIKVVMIGASVIQPNTGICAGVDESNNAYKGKISYTTESGGFTTDHTQSYASADVTAGYFSAFPNSCPKVKKAYLYWGGAAYAQNINAKYWENTVKIKKPDGTWSGNITAQYYGSTEGFESKLHGGSASSDDCTSYWAMADVTSILEGQGIGTIGVKGVTADIDDSKGGAIAGWNLVLLYEDVTKHAFPMTKFSLFDGAAFFKDGSSADVTLSFTPVSASVISGSVGLAAMDGDVGGKTDVATFRANGGASAVNLNDLRGTTDFFSSTISYNGESMMHTENVAFDCGNTLGYDAHHIDLPPGAVTTTSSQATVTLSTKDTYMMPFMAYVAVCSDVPSLVVSKVPSSTSVSPGQKLKYFIALKNEGGKRTQPNTAYVEDILDYNVEFVPNSVTITTSDGTYTNVAWTGSKVSYDATTRKLSIKQLPEIASKVTLTIAYQVQVAGVDRGDLWRSACMQEIWNMAEATYYDENESSTAKKAKSGSVNLCSEESSYNIIPVIADFDTDYYMETVVHNVTESNGSVALNTYLKNVLSAELKNDTRSLDGSGTEPDFQFYQSNKSTLVSGNLNIATGAEQTYYAIRKLTTHPYKPACENDEVEIKLVRKTCKLTTADVSVTNVTCIGNEDGQITLSGIATAQDQSEGMKFDLVSGAVSDYTTITASQILETYNTTSETSHTFKGLGAGAYSILFTDGLGCKIIKSGTIAAPTAITVSINEPAACVGNRLEFVATASGGAEGTDYYYKWYRSGNGSTYIEDESQGRSNSYSVTSGCDEVYVKAVAYSTIAECSNAECKGENTRHVTLSKTPELTLNDTVICEGGTAKLTPIDANKAANVTYTWKKSTDGGETWTADGTGATKSVSPTVTTMYQVTGTTAGGCSDIAECTVTITEIADLSMADVTACSGVDAVLTAVDANNIASPIIKWEKSTDNGTTWAVVSGATSSTLTVNLTETTKYRVTYNPDTDCEKSATNTVTIVTVPTFSNMVTSICSGSTFTVSPNDSITADASIESKLRYKWTLSTNTNITGQSAETTGKTNLSQTLTNSATTAQNLVYTVTPTLTGTTCEGTPFTVTVTVDAPLAGTITVPDPVCPSATGDVYVTMTAGTSPYTYAWTNAVAKTDASQATFTADATCNSSKTVSVLVTDLYGCTKTITNDVSWKDDAAPTITGTIDDQEPVVTGADCKFTYPDVTSLVRALSADGCTATADLTITQLPTAGSEVADPSVANTITVTVKDACNNSSTKTVTVKAIDNTPDFTVTNPSTVCNGTEVDLSTTISDADPSAGMTYSYWTNSTATTAGTQSVTPTATTTYYIKGTVTANGCTVVKPVTVTVADKVTPTFTAVGPFCSGATISALPTSSTVTDPITSAAITGTWSPAISNTTTTTYTFTPTTGLCANTQTMTITINENPTISGLSDVCKGKTITLTGSGTAAATDAWVSSNTSAATVANGVVTGVADGTTTITYTDNNGCIATKEITAATCTDIQITQEEINAACPGDDITLSLTVTNNATSVATGVKVSDVIPSGFTYKSSTPSVGTYTNGTGVWNIGSLASSGTATLTIVVTGSTSGATITNQAYISDVNGDSYTYATASTSMKTEKSTVQKSTPKAEISGTNTVCTGINSSDLTVTFTGTAPYNFTYSDGATTSSTITATTNPYTLTVSDLTASKTYTLVSMSDANCTAVVADLTGSATVTVKEKVTPTFTAVGPFCNGATISALPTSSVTTDPVKTPETAITGTWSPAISNTTTTTYTFTPTAGFCANTQTMSITINANPTISGDASVCRGETLTLTGSGTAATTNAWVSSNTSVATVTGGVVSGVEDGNVTITYTDNNGCVTTKDIEVSTCTDIKLEQADISSVCPGDDITLSLTVTNNNEESVARGVKVNDVIPSGFTYKSSTPSVGTYTNGTGVWNIGNLAAGSTATLSIVVTGSTSGATITNQAYISDVDERTYTYATATANMKTQKETKQKVTPAASISGEQIVCEDSPATTVQVSFTGTSRFTFKWSDGTTETEVQTMSNPYILNVSPTTTTTYTLVSASDANCPAAAADVTGSATVTVNASVTANAGTDQTIDCICSNASTTATLAATAPATGVTGEWTIVGTYANVADQPVITTPTAYNSTVTNLKPGSHTFRWTLTNGTGTAACTSSDDVTITINKDVTAPTFTLSQTEVTLSSGTNCVFKVPDVTTYVSTKSDNCTAEADLIVSQTPAVDTEITADQTVTITVADACGNETKKTISVKLPAKPAAPTAGDLAVCYDGNSHSATATAPTGATVVWYTAATEGTITTAPTETTAGTYIAYAASKSDATGCESETRTKVTLTIHEKPVVTVTPPAAICYVDASSTIDLSTAVSSSVTSTYKYYSDAAASTELASNVISSADAGATTLDATYYVKATSTVGGGCVSDVESIAVKIKKKPAAPTVSGVSTCPSTPGTDVAWSSRITSAEGTISWYEAETGGSPVTAPTTYNTGSAMSKTYYVSQTVEGCEGPRATLSVVINATPSAPSVTNYSECALSSSSATKTKAWSSLVTASGTQKWYDVASGGTEISEPSAFDITTAMAQQTYYVEVTDGTCTSARAAVSAEVKARPIGSVTITETSVCEDTEFDVNFTFTGGTPFSYTWSDGTIPTTTSSISTSATAANQKQTVTGVASQSYTYSITALTAANGCTSLAEDLTSDNITVYDKVVADAGTDQNVYCICATGEDAISKTSVTMAATAPVYGTGLWTLTSGTAGGTITSPSSPTTTITGLAVGTYIYTWTVTNGDCSTSDDVTIVVNEDNTAPTFTLSATTAEPTNDGDCVFKVPDLSSLVATKSDACTTDASKLVYNQTPAAGTVMTVDQTVSITITDVCGNVSEAQTVSVVMPDEPLITNVAVSDVLCPTEKATLTPTFTGVTPMTYRYGTEGGWTSITSGGTISDIASSSTLYIKDANGCTTNQAVTVVIPSAITGTVKQEAVTVPSGSDGKVKISGVSGGVSLSGYSKQYELRETDGSTVVIAYQSGLTFTGLVAGTYKVYARNITGSTPCGCEFLLGTVTVDQPSEIKGSATPTPLKCYGGTQGAKGKITAIVTEGGTSPYNFRLINAETSEVIVDYGPYGIFAPINVTTDFSNLNPGKYNVTVKDANGAEAEIATNVEIGQPDELVISNFVMDSVKCNGGSTGKIKAIAAGGVGPYNYLWNDLTAQATQQATGLSAGTYSVTVTDANGCTATRDSIVSEPAKLEITKFEMGPVSCNGAATGSLEATVIGGSGEYSYLWNDLASQTTKKASNLLAGTYYVTVTDGHGCTATRDSIVTEAIKLEITKFEMDSVSCNGSSDGKLKAIAVGGTGAYTYLWNDESSQVAQQATNLKAGTYSVTVTDINGCTATRDSVVSEPTKLEITKFEMDSVNCNGSSDGTLEVFANGGSGAYTYSWSNSQTAKKAINLAAGTYSVTVTDGHGCTATRDSVVSEPTKLEITKFEMDSVSCNGSSDGKLNIVAVGGTGTYTYSWNDESSQTTQQATGLKAGSYSVTVTDKNGCTATRDSVVSEPTKLEITKFEMESVNCNGSSDGALEVFANGGSGAYTYSWSNSQTAKKATNLAAGTYSVTVTDGHGCTATDSKEVTEPTALSITNIEMVAAKCSGSSDGTLEVAATGGTGVYTYSWNTTPVQTTKKATNLAAGTYSVTVTDANGCTATDSKEVTEPTSVTIMNFAKTPITCNGDNDGTMEVTVGGGTAPYTYKWNNSQTTKKATNLVAGTYSVTVTDANGCTANGSEVLTEPTKVVGTMAITKEIICKEDTDGEITVTVEGGTISTNDYEYKLGNDAWVEFSDPSSRKITGLGYGEKKVRVRDNNGCEAQATPDLFFSPTDKEAPVFTPTCDVMKMQAAQKAMDFGANYYTVSGKQLDLQANDNCGIASITHNLTTKAGQVENLKNNRTLEDAKLFETTTVTWTAVDVNGNVSTCTYDVEVLDLEPPTIGAADVVEAVCDANQCTFRIPTGLDEVLRKVIHDNVSKPAEMTITLNNQAFKAGTVVSKDTVEVPYKVTDKAGNFSIGVVKVWLPEVATATLTTPISSICLDGSEIQLVGGINPSSNATKQPVVIGYGGKGVNATSGKFTPSMAGVGTHTATYKIKHYGCESSASVDIVVNALPSVTIAKPGDVCQGTALTFVATATPVTTNYDAVWTINGVQEAAVQNKNTFTIDNAAAGVYNAEIMITNDNGCKSKIAKTSGNVRSELLPPKVEDYNACLDAARRAVPWTSLVSYDSNSGNLMWYDSEDAAISRSVPDAINNSVISSKTYYVTLKSSVCESRKVAVTASVHENPEIVKLNTDDVKHIELEVNKGEGPYTYWVGNSITGTFDGIADLGFASIGKHNLVVTDVHGCQATTEFTIVATPIVPDKFFSPNGDGENDLWMIQGIDYYPEAIITIHDRYGKKLAVFEGHEFEGWDGMYIGKEMPANDYWYVIQLRETGDRLVGHFLLKR